MFILSTRGRPAAGAGDGHALSVNLLLSDNEPVNLIGNAVSTYEVKGRRFG
jgi:hypothetical protein